MKAVHKIYMSLVLDSSATLAWVYSNETSQPIREIFEQVARSGAWVPSLWRLEVANVLEIGVRRGRHNSAFLTKTLSDLALLPISLDPETEKQAWTATVALASTHRLTVYDASYLELALRRSLPLATLDIELRTAALSENVPLLGL
jgi:predicted nucleic acid-binding protein